jgi:K+-transporting ATPase A subunit
LILLRAGPAVGGVTSGAITVVALVVAVVMIATAAVGYCPLYTLLRIETRGLGQPKPRS